MNRSPVPSDMWKCSKCGAANLVANCPEQCPICGHMRCIYCTKGGDSHYGHQPLRDPSESSSSRAEPNKMPYSNPSNSSTGSYSYSKSFNAPTPTLYSSSSDTNTTSSSYYSQPRRVWYCCCGNYNNEALAPYYCVHCSHKRCTGCSDTSYTF